MNQPTIRFENLDRVTYEVLIGMFITPDGGESCQNVVDLFGRKWIARSSNWTEHNGSFSGSFEVAAVLPVPSRGKPK